jgi:hypothetical protein
MPWLMIFQLFQSKIGKLLLKFVKNKELRKWLKKELFNKNLYEKGSMKKVSLNRGSLVRPSRRKDC